MHTPSAPPIILLEEHHEAFLAWNLAIARGWLPAHGNCLLHVDEHSDAYTPRLRRSVRELRQEPKELAEFTYNELTIGTWLVTALYQRLFDRSCWLRLRHEEPGRTWLYVSSHAGAGQDLRCLEGPTLEQALAASGLTESWPRSDSHRICHVRATPSDVLPELSSWSYSWVLDIDLDYFSCNVVAGSPIVRRVEITSREYQAFRQDRYHRVRLYAGQNIRVAVVAEPDGFFMEFEEFEEDPSITLRVTTAEVTRRIGQLRELLSRMTEPPRLIDLCRSRHSGYTPADQVELLERLIVHALRELWPGGPELEIAALAE